jgi:hypothetical protein
MVYEHNNQQHSAMSPLEEQAGNPVCYHQNCPVCGRTLRISVMLLGKGVYCQHCGGGFTASDANSMDSIDGRSPVADRPQATIVDELIERAAVMLGQSGE